MPRLIVVAVAALAFAVACGGEGRPRLLVAAASDLRYVFEEMEAPFEERCECDVVFSFGSSGLIATQVSQGLEVDVFASADSAYIEDLEDNGSVVSGTVQVYAIGRIVLAIGAASHLEAETLDDLLGPEFETISIANPDHAPYGLAAQQALESAGIWEAVEARLVLGENASLATQFVETRNAEAGIVPLSLAVQREGVLRYSLIDDGLHEPLVQVAAVTQRSRQPALARDFLAYLNGEEGREMMRRYGFLLPGEAP